jgi:phosphoserine phosphatase RsbU/P
MSLKNESKSIIRSSKQYVDQYTEGMTRDRIEIDYKADRERLKKLYDETVIDSSERALGKQVPFHIQLGRLFTALVMRLNPARRLFFFLTIVLFLFPYISDDGLFVELMHPLAFMIMVLLLFIELLEKLDAKKEIDLARDIQLSLLPMAEIESENLEVVSFANTALEVGGDYVDVIDTDNGTLVIIADVSGKGLPSALYMVRLQAMVHLLVQKGDYHPRNLLLELNKLIKSSNRDKTFVTVCACYFPDDKEVVVISRAGHNYPLIYQKSRNKIDLLKMQGFALGMTPTSVLDDHLEEVELEFQKGDTLLLYTDGLSEARNTTGVDFGEERIYSIFDVYGKLGAKSVIRKIQASLEEFIGDEKTLDDITITCIHRKN